MQTRLLPVARDLLTSFKERSLQAAVRHSQIWAVKQPDIKKRKERKEKN
jgi:hypothetical protein